MAEVAGLVIGGVGLLALFDSGMNAFEYVDSGFNYGSDYEKRALRLSMLHLRFSRWGESVTFTEGSSAPQKAIKVADEQEIKKVKRLLGSIGKDLEAAEKYAEDPDEGDEEEVSSSNDPNEQATLEKLTAGFKKLAISRQKRASIKKKARWALRDKTKLDRLIEDLDKSISSLTELFPAQIVEKQQQLAKKEIEELIQPSEIEEPSESSKASSSVKLLHDAASQVDSTLDKALEAKLPKRISGHTYRKTNFSGSGYIQVGDYVAMGEKIDTTPGHGNMYDDMKVSGSSNVLYGNNYGGPSVFGTRKTGMSQQRINKGVFDSSDSSE